MVSFLVCFAIRDINLMHYSGSSSNVSDQICVSLSGWAWWATARSDIFPLPFSMLVGLAWPGGEASDTDFLAIPPSAISSSSWAACSISTCSNSALLRWYTIPAPKPSPRTLIDVRIRSLKKYNKTSTLPKCIKNNTDNILFNNVQVKRI